MENIRIIRSATLSTRCRNLKHPQTALNYSSRLVPHNFFWLFFFRLCQNFPVLTPASFQFSSVPLHVLFTPNKNSVLSKIFFLLFFFWGGVNLFYLFLATLGLCCCTWAFSSCREWVLLFVAARGLLTAVASLVAEHGL